MHPLQANSSLFYFQPWLLSVPVLSRSEEATTLSSQKILGSQFWQLTPQCYKVLKRLRQYPPLQMGQPRFREGTPLMQGHVGVEWHNWSPDDTTWLSVQLFLNYDGMSTSLQSTPFCRKTWHLVLTGIQKFVLSEWTNIEWVNKNIFLGTGFKGNIHASHKVALTITSPWMFGEVPGDENEGLLLQPSRARSVRVRKHMTLFWFQILFARSPTL